jgi:hypothetical protein
MSSRFRDAEHLLRLAALFVVGILVFIVGRALLIPEGFGAIGHYRVGAIADNREQAFVYAGRGACADCHDDVVATKSEGAHAGVGCEACHGPLAAHANDPASVVPELPRPDELCMKCHRQSVAKPEGFPQVEPEEHAMGEECTACHEPHVPL